MQEGILDRVTTRVQGENTRSSSLGRTKFSEVLQVEVKVGYKKEATPVGVGGKHKNSPKT